MIKVEHINTYGFEAAIRGMRNPMNSWDKSDSYMNYSVELTDEGETRYPYYRVGAADLSLMRKLYHAGPEHRKYLRQIFVSMDIIAPLYWWKEFDTYKVGTVANSCSTMHKIHTKEFELDDFSHDYLEELKDDDYNYAWQDWNDRIRCLNYFRDKYNATKDKRYWRMMIEKLPSSYNQKRTITMNYENVVTMIKQRTGHKLDEWNVLVDILKELPNLDSIVREE